MYPPSELRSALVRSLDPSPSTQVEPGDRLAGVLVLVIRSPEPSLVLTLRTDHLSRHAGEISFPGGMEEEGDGTLSRTALREAEEELGLEASSVDMLGALPPVHTFVSGILIVPFVGMLEVRPVFFPNEGEIAEVLEFPLARLEAAEQRVEWSVGDHVYRGHAYEIDGVTIWGATAMILHRFLALVPTRGVEA